MFVYLLYSYATPDDNEQTTDDYEIPTIASHAAVSSTRGQRLASNASEEVQLGDWGTYEAAYDLGDGAVQEESSF